MALEDIKARGMVLLGCGKMGSAMLAGWLAEGVPPGAVWVLDPAPSDWLRGTGVHINEGLPGDPAVALIAVKPQMMGDALPGLQALGAGTVILSVAAGTRARSPATLYSIGFAACASMAREPAMLRSVSNDTRIH